MPNKSVSGQETPILINELHIRATDRSRKDIQTWRAALGAAESVSAPNRTRLYDLYADVLLDGHLTGVIAKRMDAVLNKELYFENEQGRVASMQPLITSLPFRRLMATILETLLWGCSGIEFLPGSTFGCSTIPRKHINTTAGIVSYDQGGTEGIPFADLPHVWVLGSPNDLGLLLKCAPYSLYKRGALADWAEYIEIFGQPVRVIKYDSYDTQTRAELRKVLDESGSALSMMLPRQVDFEMIDGKQSNSDGSLQLSFIKNLNDEMSILILGNTETTSASNSTGYAQSRIHLQQQYEITRSDLQYVAGMLNTPYFHNVLKGYGYAMEGGRFAFSKDMDIEYLTQRITIDKEIAEKVAIPAHYWYDTYGINAPNQTTEQPKTNP